MDRGYIVPDWSRILWLCVILFLLSACRPNFLFSDGPHTYSLALGDLDGDGDPDVYLANGANEVPEPDQVWLSQGAGQFTNSAQSLGRNETHRVLLVDLDLDGDLDAVVDNTGALQIRFNDGSGHFSAAGQTIYQDEVGAYTFAVSAGDLNGDGSPDLFLGACCGGSLSNGVNKFLPPYNMVWFNDGQGFFSDSGQRLGPAGSEATALGDLDGDGDLDAFVANASAMTGAQSGSSQRQPDEVWLNDGLGYFTRSGQNLGRTNSHAAALGDLNGDRQLDALVGTDDGVQIWINSGGGFFQDGGSASPGGSYNPNETFRLVQLADLDADGDLDAFLWRRGAGAILLNDGRGNLALASQSIDFPKCDAASLGDLDGDGDPDIFAFLYPDQPRAWLNDGAGSFTLLSP